MEARCNPGDGFVGISTSKNSRNVSIALLPAREMGAFTVAITGEHGGYLASGADVWICIPSRDTARIQEAYMLCGHMLCDWIELATCILVESGFGHPRVLVVGDVMLDKYVWGDASLPKRRCRYCAPEATASSPEVRPTSP